nr:hypothetical protein [Tanacetum cinerariifolium]
SITHRRQLSLMPLTSSLPPFMVCDVDDRLVPLLSSGGYFHSIFVTGLQLRVVWFVVIYLIQPRRRRR